LKVILNYSVISTFSEITACAENSLLTMSTNIRFGCVEDINMGSAWKSTLM